MTCNCNDNYGCGGACDPCSSNTAIKQAVNDALAAEKVTLEGYVTDAATSATESGESAADAAASASAAAQSQTNAETAASTATQAATSAIETAIVLEETSERIEQAQDLLEEQISALQTKPVYFEVSTPTSSLVLPETESVFNVRSIYIASARQAMGYGFTFDKDTRTVTLAEEITAEQIAETEEGYILVEVICDVYSSDDPTSFPIQIGSSIGASLVGTTSGDSVQTALDNLSKVEASDGYKVLGYVTSLAELRTIEPDEDGQAIQVQLSNMKARITYIHDASDTTSPDDSGLTVVSTGGKRWKLDAKANAGIDNYGFSYNPITALTLTSAYAGLNSRGEIYKGASNHKIPGSGLKIWKPTYGTLEDAVILSIRNTETSTTDPAIPVLNVKNPTTRAGYGARDHVGGYIGMDSMPATVSTTSTTYTATSVTSADFATAIAANKIKVGMLIDTTDSPKKTAIITAIDSATNTLMVDSWVTHGGGGATTTPTAGVGASVNPMTGLWGMNIIVGLASAHNVSTAAYIIEGDIRNNKATGAGHGMYMRCADSSYAAGNAYWAVGGSSAHWTIGLAAQYCDTGVYTDNTTPIGFWSNNSPTAIRIRGATTALTIGTATTTYASMDGLGTINGLRLKPTVFAASATIDNLSVICTGPTVTAATTINLPEPTAARELARILVLKNPVASTANIFFGGGVEDSSGSIIVRPGESVVVFCNGSLWIPIASRLQVDSLSGSGTLAAAATSVTISHALGATPSAVTLGLTASYTGNYWVSAKTSTNFTVSFSAAPEAAVTFDWILRR